MDSDKRKRQLHALHREMDRLDLITFRPPDAEARRALWHELDRIDKIAFKRKIFAMKMWHLEMQTFYRNMPQRRCRSLKG